MNRYVLSLALALVSPSIAVAQPTPPASDAQIAADDTGDTDGDGLPDIVDACPTQPENYNNHVDDDGCPDPPTDLSTTPSLRVWLPMVGRGALFSRGVTQMLDLVARSLRANPAIQQITIETHTDTRGSGPWNLRLSQLRAEWVRSELVRRGVEPSRVVARGFGEDCPLDTSGTLQGQQRNRRAVVRVTRSSDPRWPMQSVGCPAATTQPRNQRRP
ncbi:MAG: OmpA family protein [Myxococcales bacterium]|nr:OmpA family protein [Myxococcales bacterium]